METRPDPLVTVFTSSDEQECLDHSLVLVAVGIRHAIRKVDGKFALVVAAGDEARSQEELEAYDLENRDGTTATPIAYFAGGWVGVAGYAAVVTVLYALSRWEVLGADWFAAGRTHAGLIRQGQWWRAVTALTLHVDGTHLLANLLIGGLIGLFAGQVLGSGLAWISILAAGTTGNLLNAWIRSPDHISVGASTAVFAALGLASAYRWWQRRGEAAGWTSQLAGWTPVIGGVVLLSLLGTGGERTDVAAHLTGFASGIVLGSLYGMLGRRVMLRAGAQLVLGTAALGVVALAWSVALAR